MNLPHDHGQEAEHMMETFPDPKEFQTAAEMFRQLGDASRIRIFWILCHCEECVINISAMMNMTSPAVSHHLKLLKDAGLITGTRVGKEVYYKAANNRQAAVLHEMIEQMFEISCPSRKEKV